MFKIYIEAHNKEYREHFLDASFDLTIEINLRFFQLRIDYSLNVISVSFFCTDHCRIVGKTERQVYIYLRIGKTEIPRD
jgi:hypothetical protein